MNRIIAAAASALILLTACRHTGADNDATLVVSIEPQRAVLAELVEPGTEIVTLMSRGANPETFEPTLSQRASLDGASMYFVTGALPFEENIRKAVPDLEIIDTSAGVEPVYGTHSHAHVGHHSHGHDEGEPDPHFWTSIEGTRAMARNMAAALIVQDPANVDTYRTRLKAFEHKVDSVAAEISLRLSSTPHRTFAVWHPSLSYFAREYSLKQVVVGQESKEMSARQLREVIDAARADSITVFFFQKEYDSRQAESINSEIGSRMVTIDPLDPDWAAQLINIADELARD